MTFEEAIALREQNIDFQTAEEINDLGYNYTWGKPHIKSPDQLCRALEQLKRQ